VAFLSHHPLPPSSHSSFESISSSSQISSSTLSTFAPPISPTQPYLPSLPLPPPDVSVESQPPSSLQQLPTTQHLELVPRGRRESTEIGPQCGVKDCRLSCTSTQELVYHMKRTHPSEKGELFYCPACTQHFSLGFGWDKHQLSRIHLYSLGDQVDRALLTGKLLQSEHSDGERQWLFLSVPHWALFLVITLYLLTALASCAWSIYLGFSMNQLQCEKNLSLWLKIYGVIGIIANLSYFFGGIKSLIPKRNRLTYVLLCFLSWHGAWFLLGSIWIYPIPFHSHLCPDLIFQTVFYIVSITWGVVVVLCCIVCVFVSYSFSK